MCFQIYFRHIIDANFNVGYYYLTHNIINWIAPAPSILVDKLESYFANSARQKTANYLQVGSISFNDCTIFYK